MNTGMLTKKQIQASNVKGSMKDNIFFWNLTGAMMVKKASWGVTDVEKSTDVDLLVVGLKGPKETFVRDKNHFC